MLLDTRESPISSPLTYKDAGVDINAGDELVDAIKPTLKQTARAGSMGQIGGFAALFDLKASGYQDPLIVSCTDGVGTKLLVAIETGQVDTIGQDLVAMCVNDLLCQGAEPLFFLDYFATGQLDPNIAKRVIVSIAKACEASGCALVGGETAEMPRMYQPGHFDLAGFSVGAVERDQVLPRLDDIKQGDKLWGLASNGLHSNGFSLFHAIRAKLGLDWDAAAPWLPEVSVAQDALRPTHLYVQELKPLFGLIKAATHITGGGLPGNVIRALPDGLSVQIDTKAWKRASFFDYILDQGLVAFEEAYRTFNMGLGMVLIADASLDLSDSAVCIGEVQSHTSGAPLCQLIA